ncbi:MAG: hypothetical protein K8T20_15590 [Planctomycetes bacterium]|nr:hypothetical protein [Planctomycetota bacterium]
MSRPGRFVCSLWLICGASALAEDAAPAHSKDLMGAWKNTAKDEEIRFEPRRLTVHGEGLLNIFRARYEEAGKFSYCVEATWYAATWSIKDKTLTMVNGKETSTYTRLDSVPPGLELKPLAFGKSAPVPADKLKEIQKELAERVVKDQAVRTDPDKAGDMESVDRDNTVWLKKLVLDSGWVDTTRFGQETSHSAFLIVQHSGDLPLMVAALPEIEKDLKAGLLRDGQAFALLYDRTMLSTGEKQRYGTQISTDGGKIVVLPIESKAKVDEYRKAIGVFPLSEYLEIFKKETGATEVEFMED